MMESKYLIINADDFGMCHSYNEAVFHLLEEGKITSSTLMPVTPGRDEAAEWCVRKKIKCVGLHTTFTSEWESFRWSSLTRLPSLEDENGYLYLDVAGFLSHARREDVAKEMEAQFQWFEKSGIFFSHVDNHMGSIYPSAVYDIPDYLPLVFDCCDRYGKLPFRMFRGSFWDEGTFQSSDYARADIEDADRRGLALVDTLYSYPFRSSPETTYEMMREELCQLMHQLNPGFNEIYFHPSIDTEEVRRITPTWQRRIWDFKVLMDDEFQYAIRDAGVKLINYRELQKMRGLA